MISTEELLEISRQNSVRARGIITLAGITQAWESIGAEPRLVGSLRTGLMMRRKDIDYHIYSDRLDVEESFAAMARIAANPAISRVTYNNLIDTDEHCIEWHAWYDDGLDEEWQLDMIHILRGSLFDGYFERVGDRLSAILTDETRAAILRLKYLTPADMKVGGITYYRAVIEAGLRDWESFACWLDRNPVAGIELWMPPEPGEYNESKDKR